MCGVRGKGLRMRRHDAIVNDVECDQKVAIISKDQVCPTSSDFKVLIFTNSSKSSSPWGKKATICYSVYVEQGVKSKQSV